MQDLHLSSLDESTPGVLPDRLLSDAIAAGHIDAGEYRIPPDNIQPASVDLRLGEFAWRIRCSFLPDTSTVERKVKDLIVDEIDLRKEGAVLDTNRPYLIPLIESLNLPAHIRGKANPKSSTGRLDVFTRVVTDHSYRFDEIAPGYEGCLYLEVVPLSFAIRVRHGLALNQLRLMIGRPSVSDDELWQHHEARPLLYIGGRPASRTEFAAADGLFLSLDLRARNRDPVGYRAKANALPLDMARVGSHEISDYWDLIYSEEHSRIVLDPESFYLLLSRESVSVPPTLASEMTAYDPTSGELRTHYAGFFDPGFGHDTEDRLSGSRAALEVRAHDVPFMVEHGQRVCKLTFQRMLCPPTRLYGQDIGSHYQGQTRTLGKHFRAEPGAMGSGARRASNLAQAELFAELPDD
jgi:dCTP deaminase